MTRRSTRHRMQLGDIDLTANSFVFTISRELAIMYGHVKPTPEEVERYNAEARARWKQSVEQWAALDAAAAELANIVDPLARKILDLHACADDATECLGCSIGNEDDPYDEPWPCATVRVVAEQYGVTLPEGYFGSRPSDVPHAMPPDGYTPFVAPAPRWFTHAEPT